MSFAVIQTGGKQYKVSTNEILKIERVKSQEGKTVEFKNVLFLNDDKTTEIGNPNIQGAKVEATILKNKKNKTVLVFKKRRRKNSRKKYGHRQPISVIKITKIFSKNGKLITQPESEKETISVKKEKLVPVKKEEAKETSSKTLKAGKMRKIQQDEAKKIDELEKKRLKEEQVRIKLGTKKSDLNKKKKTIKKKPLTTKKK